MAEEEDYGFEYSDEEPDDEDFDIENAFYNAEALFQSGAYTEALAGFEEVLRLEEEKGEWGFKALEKIVQILYRENDLENMLGRYKELLEYIKTAVTRNESEKSINAILEFVSAAQQSSLLQEFYETTLQALHEAKNERLWFKTNLKLGKMWFEAGEFQKLTRVLRELQKSCRKDDGSDDHRKGTALLEVYALEIQMYTATKNTKKLKSLYQRALLVKSAIPHPNIMGIIRECGGKMHMEERSFDSAFTDFYEAFKNYDEAGNARRIICLKYLVLANMLSLSEINPFDSPEAKPYANNPEIVAMTNLVSAYSRKDIHEFEIIINSNKTTIMGDPFIQEHIQELLSKFRTQVLLKLIKPYSKISLPFISEQLNIPAEELEPLLVTLILDRKVVGYIDQVTQMLDLQVQDEGEEKNIAIQNWSHSLRELTDAIMVKMH